MMFCRCNACDDVWIRMFLARIRFGIAVCARDVANNLTHSYPIP